MFYIIAREAADGFWGKRFKQDPKKIPMKLSMSAYYSNLGKTIPCKLWYSVKNLEQARQDCSKLNILDPEGGYALCPMRE